MIDVVTDAVHRLGRDQWWDSVHNALDEMNSSDLESYQTETTRLDATAADGLDAR